ncbi:transposase (plasmid) [Streptomyces sp. NBC_01320]|nr:transposase [Streptomyces sp. NBC_01320]
MPAASSGYDGERLLPGRKRHIVTDMLGLLLVVAVTAANVGVRDAAGPLLQRLRMLHREIALVWAGGLHRRPCPLVPQNLSPTLEVVKRTDTMEGFVLPRRWVVERTLCAMRSCFYPRFSRDGLPGSER